MKNTFFSRMRVAGICLLAGAALVAFRFADMVEVSLASHGIPVSFQAPAGAEVKKGLLYGDIDGVPFLDYTVSKGRFIMSVSMLDEVPEYNLEDAVASSRENAEGLDDFGGYVLEEKQGFIYKVKTDDGYDHCFSYTVQVNDHHVEFTQGLALEDFTLEEAKVMYNAAKTAH